MRRLNYELKELANRNRDGSFATQSNRRDMLKLIADQLHSLGFRRMSARGLKPKHVHALVNHWHDSGIAVGTIKNRMSVLRWWAARVDKRPVVERENEAYGIGKRQYVTNENKACSVDNAVLNQVGCQYLRFSLRLQQAFGLRREESIKFNPVFADQGDRILLKSTWTKGGKEREIPIRNEEQRKLINELRQYIGNRSLIPADKKYIQQLKVYENVTASVGLSKLHGLRHRYAQNRYHEITGKFCPAEGGESPSSVQEREIDKMARLIISQELGHHREQITAVYLGR